MMGNAENMLWDWMTRSY